MGYFDDEDEYIEKDEAEEMDPDADFVISGEDVEELRGIMQEIRNNDTALASRLQEILNNLVEV